MTQYNTEQEKFWAGEFGDAYTSRNNTDLLLASNLALFTRVLKHTANIHSIIEFGSNIGLNLRAIQQLLPQVELAAIEINEKAVAVLKHFHNIKVYHKSLFDFVVDYQRDLVLIKGVLIHLNPDLLAQAYDLIFHTSKKYICMAEYYNPTPVAIPYRGHKEKLFKRDFAGEMLDRFTNLKLLDYGFCYHRDSLFPQDDITWFLLEKSL